MRPVLFTLIVYTSSACFVAGNVTPKIETRRLADPRSDSKLHGDELTGVQSNYWGYEYMIMHHGGKKAEYFGVLLYIALSDPQIDSEGIKFPDMFEEFMRSHSDSLLLHMGGPNCASRFEPYESLITATMLLLHPTSGDSDKQLRTDLASFLLRNSDFIDPLIGWTVDFCLVGQDCDAVLASFKLLSALPHVRSVPEYTSFLSKLVQMSTFVKSNSELSDAVAAMTAAVSGFITGQYTETIIRQTLEDALTLVQYAEADLAAANVSV